ncbi:MAG: hypothetical protein JSS27_03385 [Planctomycetes bacterium]|nr:hypothetical protein [Planctomycetota bacterium]
MRSMLYVAVAILVAHAGYYYPFFSDDAFISLRFAARLLGGQGLTWTDGESVEGYSNLLWVLLMAASGAVGVDLVTAARALGMICTGATVAWLFASSIRGRGTTSFIPSLVAAALAALSAPLAVWSIAGLEQPLFGMFLIGSIAATIKLLEGDTSTNRQLWQTSLPLGLLCLTRPDGLLLVAIIVAVAAGFVRLRMALVLAALPALAVGGQLAFRLWYYHDWLPNTAYVKLAPSVERLRLGLDYVRHGCWVVLPLFVAAAMGVVAGVRGYRRRAVILLATLTAIWLAYVAAIGGDVFPAYRMFGPVAVCLACLTVVGVQWLASAGLRPLALLTGTAALLAASAIIESRDAECRRANEERWEWGGQQLALELRRRAGDARPLMAVTAAGCLPYYTEFPALDMLGLCDRHIARQPPATSDGWLAHDHGDGRYVLDRRPELIVFHIGSPQPMFVSGLQMAADPRFHRDYRQVKLPYGPERKTAYIWVRRDSAIDWERPAGEDQTLGR